VLQNKLTSFSITVLPRNALVIISSKFGSLHCQSLLQRLATEGRPDISILDAAFVVSSSQRSKIGTSTLLLSGPTEALEDANTHLQLCSGSVRLISGGLGQASKVEMVNQLLTALHTAAAAEAMGLAAKAGLNTQVTFDIISNAAGSSSAFESRVPHMLSGDWKSHQTSWQSTLNSLVRLQAHLHSISTSNTCQCRNVPAQRHAKSTFPCH
jgi:3-hydroxyisobutyrate dehydrogenase-like beta-hydroxyacid dehydrogenase